MLGSCTHSLHSSTILTMTTATAADVVDNLDDYISTQEQLRWNELTHHANMRWSLPQPYDPALWFDDGDVIIATDSLYFKIQASVLSQHSRVLNEMLLDTTRGSGTLWGRRVIHVPEEALHFKRLLEILYIPQEWYVSVCCTSHTCQM